jgi:cyanophycinase
MAENRDQSKSAPPRKTDKRDPDRTPRRKPGTLFIIGGSEDKQNTKVILSTLAERIGSGRLVISTLASQHGEEVWEVYRKLFTALGVKQIRHLGIGYRDEMAKSPQVDIFDGVTALFFTGGDQLRITTSLGGTKLFERIEEVFNRGGVIAGTSAGAAALSEMMLVGSPGNGAYKVGDAFQMVPGLGLVRDVIIDQHFSERGRIKRLLGAVAQNPRLLGIGIDEDTAIIVEGSKQFRVIGSGAVYMVDGHDLTFTNIAEDSMGRTMSVFGIKLHVLSQGDSFDLSARAPLPQATEEPAPRSTGKLKTPRPHSTSRGSE